MFPSRKPDQAAGPGALVWPGADTCPGGPGARVQAIAERSAPAPAARPRSASGALIAPGGALAAASAPHGQIAVSGADPRRPGAQLLVQGRADGRFRTLIDSGALASPGVLTTAYLGDLALLAPAHGGELAIRIERWFANEPGSVRPVAPRAPGPLTAAVAAMDFRSDAIAAWARAGSVWVADAPARDETRAPRRIGPAGTRTRIAALLSDDDRAMVMWSASSGTTTSVWLDYSRAGPRFGPPQLLERYTDPASQSPPPGSPQLIRLSSESVMAAWAGAEAGHWVVRTAPIDQRGLRTVSTLGASDSDVRLQALAPGPNGDAIVLFTEPRPDAPLSSSLLGGQEPDPSEAQTLLSARGSEATGQTLFAAPEEIAAIPRSSTATVAIEPGTDRAVAAWLGEGGLVQYSIRTAGSGG